MRKLFYILTGTFLLVSCHQNSSAVTDNKLTDTTTTENLFDTIAPDQQEVEERLLFKHVSEIVADNSYSTWTEQQGEETSLTLHFQYKDILAVSYSSECWLRYPYKLDGDKIVVYWDNEIDTKYEFDIVTAIGNADKEYIGKPFMILELENDTTLNATYPMKQLINEINGASKYGRVFFPDKYELIRYDF